MSTIRAPYSAPPNVLGIGRHRLNFGDDGVCPDPGLNAGERAYLRGRGFVFEDTAPDAEPAPAPAAVEAKPKRAARRKSTTTPEPADTVVEAEGDA